jgi:hypothetical protein
MKANGSNKNRSHFCWQLKTSLQKLSVKQNRTELKKTIIREK